MVFSSLRPPKSTSNGSTSRRNLLRSSSSNSSIPSPRSQSPVSELASSLRAASAVFKDVKKQEADLAELNTSLSVLTALFPNVRHEVFREMLVSISGESRLHVVAEQL